MIHDVVYGEHYARRIAKEVQQAASHFFAQGRQQGWTDSITALQHLNDLGLEPTVENFIMILQNNVLNNKHDAELSTESNIKEVEKEKPILSLVPN